MSAQPEGVPAGTAAGMLESAGLPIEPMTADVALGALRAWRWMEGETERLDLDGWVEVRIGEYVFKAGRAAIWIHTHEVARVVEGKDEREVVHEVAAYFEKLTDASRPGGMSAAGGELLVTAATIGKVSLRCDSFTEGTGGAERAAFEGRAEARLAERLNRDLRIDQARGGGGARVEGGAEAKAAPIDMEAAGQAREGRIQDRETARVVGGGEEKDREAASVGEGAGEVVAGRRETGGTPIPPGFGPVKGTVLFRFDQLEYRMVAEGQDEGTAVLQGNIVIQYVEIGARAGGGAGGPRQLTISADRAVVFTDPVTQEEFLRGQMDADSVRGVYLEGNVVASDGGYTLRGPRMYYEFDTNRAVVLDAVMSSYNEEARVPVYLRAAEIRQTARDEWSAERVRVSTSEFYTPGVSLGASSLRLQRRTDEAGRTADYLRAKDMTVRAGEMPIFWWPGYSGPVADFPLKSVQLGASGRQGVGLSVEFDLLGLMGWERAGGLDSSLLVDYYTERGPGVGLEFDYEDAESRGHALGYVIQDHGTDKLASGVEKELDSETRGIIDFWHMEKLPDDWTLLLEGSYISDVNFVDAFFGSEASNRREYQTRAYLKQQRDNWALEIFARYDLNEFIPNEDLLQAQGYMVEKLPEIGWYQYGGNLLGDKISYSSEYRLSRMRIALPRHTLAEIGQGMGGFGLPGTTDLTAAGIAAGLREETVNRFHTRQEMSMPFEWGGIKVVPFVVGRFTAYDSDFREFDVQAEDQRYYGAAGVRLHTQFVNVNEGVDNRFLDLHRLRHIIEPSVTVWHGESDADASDYPIYDYDVEAAATGTQVKLGLRNTWQTQRGGAGRWRSVDVLRMDTDVVMSASETQGDFLIPRYFDYRPEYSRIGDHFKGDFAWQASDALAVGGHMILDTNENVLARSSLGFRMDHSPRFSTSAEARYFDAGDATLLNFGLAYTLTPRYRMRGNVNFDLELEEARDVGVLLTRRQPQFDVTLGLDYSQFREETTLSLIFTPAGAAGRSTFGGILGGGVNN